MSNDDKRHVPLGTPPVKSSGYVKHLAPFLFYFWTEIFSNRISNRLSHSNGREQDPHSHPLQGPSRNFLITSTMVRLPSPCRFISAAPLRVSGHMVKRRPRRRPNVTAGFTSQRTLNQRSRGSPQIGPYLSPLECTGINGGLFVRQNAHLGLFPLLRSFHYFSPFEGTETMKRPISAPHGG